MINISKRGEGKNVIVLIRGRILLKRGKMINISKGGEGKNVIVLIRGRILLKRGKTINISKRGERKKMMIFLNKIRTYAQRAQRAQLISNLSH